MGKKWSQERKDAAKAVTAERNAAKKSAQIRADVRVPIGAKRELLNVSDTPEGYKDRIVNDNPGRIEKFKRAGYEIVENATLGTSHVDGTSANAGAASKDVGKGVTAYVMRQRLDYYNEDQAAKQQQVDESEASNRRSKVNAEDSTDGSYGEVKIG